MIRLNFRKRSPVITLKKKMLKNELSLIEGVRIYRFAVTFDTDSLKLKYLSDFEPCSSHTQKQ